MADLVETTLEDDRWLACDLNGLAQRFCSGALAHLGYSADTFTIGLLGCGDTRIQELNRQFRGKSLATNVLSWPSAERSSSVPGQAPEPVAPDPHGETELGDIAIAFGVCQREATAFGKPIEQHVGHLLVHGTLHLLGYDHIQAQDAQNMETIERQILASLGQPDPYEVRQEISLGTLERENER